jgi:hypothetical protein
MKKTLVSLVVIMALAGCNAPSDPTPTPTEVPTVEVSPSETPTEAPEPNPEPVPTKDDGGSESPKPTPQSPAPTTSEAGTPATQFAERWGKRYPSIPEFAILKAANRTCDVIGAAGNGWESDPLVQLALKEGIGAFGLSDNDALEFAQDANQNYCSSVGNPT